MCWDHLWYKDTELEPNQSHATEGKHGQCSCCHSGGVRTRFVVETDAFD